MWAKHKQTGFTIVELLIVIVVIGILAAISIVAYNGIQDRAIDVSVKSDLANFSKKVQVASIDSGGSYSYPLTASMELKISKNTYLQNRYNWYYCLTPDRQSYAVGVVSSKDKGYFMSSSFGLQENQIVGGAQTCNVIGTSPSLGLYTYGHIWDGSVGTWTTWLN